MRNLAVVLVLTAIVGYEFPIAEMFTGGPRLEMLAVDTGSGVTARTTNLVFSFTF